MARLLIMAATLWLAAGCNSRPDLTLGEECVLNSDCAAPLGCRLGQCRRLCISSRDCGIGFHCIAMPGETSGACQLDAETECVMSSECRSPLVCSFGTCSTECFEDRDCVAGSICVEGTCTEPIDELCVYTSDCPPPYVCAPDQTCQYECVEDRDCLAPRTCVANLCELPAM